MLQVTPELACYLPILSTFGWNGGFRDDTRPPGLRQGTTVFVHTNMDVEQLSDHKLMTPSGMGLLVCGAGSHPSCHLGVQEGMCQQGVNLNQYAGPGSHIRWHSDDEPLFGPQYSPMLIISLSLGNSVVFKVRRRAPGEVPSSIRLDHGDVLVTDGLAQSECGHRTASGLQGPPLRLVHYQAWWVVFSQRVRKVQSSQVPVGWERGKRNGPLVNPGVCPSGQHLDSHWEGASSQSSASIPLGGVPPLSGSCSLGREDGVGDCHDVANFPGKCPFISLFLGKLYAFFFKRFWFLKFVYG